MPTKFKWTATTDTAWATAGNWNPSGPPATSGDSATFDQDATRLLAASNQSATTLATLLVKDTFTYSIGDAATPMQVGATSWRFGDSSGASRAGGFSGRLNFDFGTAQFIGVVVGSAAASTDNGKEPVRIKGTHASNLLYVQGGLVGVATDNLTDTAQLATIFVTGGTVNIGSGVTLAKLEQESGVVNMQCGATTVEQDGGTLNTSGSGAITTATISSATANLNSTGTITTLNIQAAGIVNLLGDYQAKTITTINLYAGATLSYDPGVHTITNPINLIGCSLSEVTIKIPRDATLAIVKT